MKLSNQYIKTIKDLGKEFDSRSHELLVKAGFIDQVASGIYTFLPPALKVLNKIENIVRTELNKLGSMELLLPSLHPKILWDTTDRWDAKDFHFKINSAHDRKYALGASHEEVSTPLAQKYITSYKDLPLSFYQIATKYRDEARPKSGIMRGREFRMNDMYSFHATKEDLVDFYQKTLLCYIEIYRQLGLETVRITEASGGVFTENRSHEFSVPTPAGEDDLLFCTSCDFTQNLEIAKKDMTVCPKCKGQLEKTRAIEVGNIFQYDFRYSEKFNFKFVDESGKNHLVYTGAYGIGTSRLIGAIVEVHNDTDGIIWPDSVTPFSAHLCLLTESKRKFADLLYRSLQSENLDILYDDRSEVSAGEKMAVADLVGAPVRLIVSEKAGDAVEVKLRTDDQKRLLTPTAVIQHLKEYFIEK